MRHPRSTPPAFGVALWPSLDAQTVLHEVQVAEESGATSLAGAIQLGKRVRDKKVAIILSGGNMTLEGLRLIYEKNKAKSA